jgi:hypothetical protein
MCVCVCVRVRAGVRACGVCVCVRACVYEHMSNLAYWIRADIVGCRAACEQLCVCDVRT